MMAVTFFEAGEKSR